MTTIELRRAYQSFFLKNEAGKQFMTSIEKMIESQHAQAENTPELARDYAQRAKGVREVMSHIKSLTAERGLPRA